jgi:hypothetical protein
MGVEAVAAGISLPGMVELGCGQKKGETFADVARASRGEKG